ncbi:hypothetical protein PPYR_14849, partial [Photinus pyralis]
FKIDVDDADFLKQDLKIVLSTKRLLKLLGEVDKVQADATYKLVWQGYPVLIVGTSDICRKFHPLAVAVCFGEAEADFAFIFQAMKQSYMNIHQMIWKPNVLLADASVAITNGFKSVFGTPARRLQCFFHVLKNVDSVIRGITEKTEIGRDLHALQLCIDDEVFIIAENLFLKKWESKNVTNHQAIKDFINYFKKTWLGINRFWYEGACARFPSTNNGLESINATIKKEHTLRERLPVGQFMEALRTSLVEKWSYERNPENPNYKPFFSTIKLTTKLWTDAYQWVKLKPKMFEEKSNEKTIYYTKSTNATEVLNQEEMQTWKNTYLKWECFDDFRKSQTVLKLACYSENEELVSQCTCSRFLKEYICEHSLGLLVILGKAKVPIEAKSVPLGQKRKRGRPTTAKKALIIQ